MAHDGYEIRSNDGESSWPNLLTAVKRLLNINHIYKSSISKDD